MQVAIISAANGDRRSRQIAKDMRACQRSLCSGRIGRPKILANLYPECETGQIICGKDNVCPKGHFLPAQLKPQPLTIAAMGEIALFIKLAVIGQIAFGYNSQNIAACDHDAAIVYLPIAAQSGPNNQDRA